MSELYDFPMTLEEAKLIHDCLLEAKNTFRIGMRERFTTEEKEMLGNIVDNLGTWIENRDTE